MTPPLSRHRRRAAEKEARQYYERHGMSPGRGTVPLILHTQTLIRILSNSQNESRASDAAEASIGSFDLSARNHPAEFALACRRGCAFCCHDPVAATAPEVFRIARHVLGQAGPDVAAALGRLKAAHVATAGDSPEDRVRRRRPCAMLEGNACTGYAVRPLACRSANSGSAQACEDAFHNGATPIPVAKVPIVLRDSHLLCLLAALQAVGLDNRAYELNHALWLAVSVPDAERRWVHGEDVFASVRTTQPAGTAQASLIRSLLYEAGIGPKSLAIKRHQ